jgi:intraflagellar transport protein 88
MKKGLQKLVSIRPPAIEQDEGLGPLSSDEPIEDHEVFNEDSLRAISRERFVFIAFLFGISTIMSILY